MSFHEVRLPVAIEQGARGGPRFKTTILTLASGHERRNIDWQRARGLWDISYGLLAIEDETQAEETIERLLEFFYARQGRAHGFRFKDWADFRIGNAANPAMASQEIGLGDDTTTTFQVFKRYANGGVFYDRVVQKLVDGTVSVLLDGVVQMSGATVDITTGVVTFDTPPASTGGTGSGGEQVVAVVCEFDVPVRFDIDHLDLSMRFANLASIQSIPLVELRATA
jgi:uncharacterized protein (TIGR02217 family)